MALTASRASNQVRGNQSYSPVAADTIIYGGSAVELDASGNAVEAGTGVTGFGVALETVDNRGGLAGAKSISTEAGTYLFPITGAGAVARADIGHAVGWVDGGTPTKVATGHTNSVLANIIDGKAAVFIGVPSIR